MFHGYPTIRAKSHYKGENCLFLSEVCHHNGKPSATGLFAKGQNLVADGQTSKTPSTVLTFPDKSLVTGLFHSGFVWDNSQIAL